MKLNKNYIMQMIHFYVIAVGLLFGNWLVVPRFFKKRTYWDGFFIGVIAAAIMVAFGWLKTS
jgi:predicted permease